MLFRSLATAADWMWDPVHYRPQRAFLGEGWNAPCVNCLVDLTSSPRARSDPGRQRAPAEREGVPPRRCGERIAVRVAVGYAVVGLASTTVEVPSSTDTSTPAPPTTVGRSVGASAGLRRRSHPHGRFSWE